MDTIIGFYNWETDTWLEFDYFHCDSDYCLAEPRYRAMIAFYGITNKARLMDEIAYAIWKYEVDHGIAKHEDYEEFKNEGLCYEI